MIVKVILLYKDNLFQSTIENGQSISFGSHKKDSVLVKDYPQEGIIVKWKKTGISIIAKKTYGFEQDSVPLDTVISLSKDKKAVLFLSPVVITQGYSFKLPYHCILKIGRTNKNDIVIKLPFVSSEHFILKNESGNIRVEDLNSTNGLYLNGKRIKIARLKSGDTLSILSVDIKLNNGELSFENVGNKISVLNTGDVAKTSVKSHFVSQNGHLTYRRSPRMQNKLPNTDIILSNAPSKGQKFEKGRGVFSALAGSGAMFASSLITSVASPALLAARAASLVSPVANATLSGGSNKKRKKKSEQYEALRQEKYGAYINDQKARIESVAKIQREIIERENPEPKKCVETLFGLKQSLWERMPADRDFLDVRVGMGYENLCVNVKSRQDASGFQMEDDEIRELSDRIIEETRIVDDIPARVSLLNNNTIGIIGDRRKMIQLIKNMLIELTVFHCFEDVRIVGIFDKSEYRIWESLKWLPHIWDENNQFRMLAFEKDEAHNLCETLNELVKGRREAIKGASAQPRVSPLPHYVFLLGSKDMVEKEQIMRNLLFNNPGFGVTSILLFDELYLLPNECKYIIDLDNGPCAFDKTDVSNKFFFTMDNETDSKAFEFFARRMSAVELEGLSAKSSLPNSLTFLQGYKVKTVEELNVWNRWSSALPYKSLGATIGYLAGDKPFALDIHEKAHGPHGLVAGTTGSGKSELLQTWILSMALTYHPYDVVFVLIDYKGGGMANLLEPLPHVVGKITNIGSNITRSLVSLQSEIKRRLAIFDNYGVNHIDKYQKLYKSGNADEPLPHLIIVADEFAELKKEEPEFMSGLISASRVGRSLGIHLILATQKPGGVVDDQIQSNSRFRLCLKVQDANDSREMIKRPDAAKITQAGRAYIRVGEDEYFDLFQSFWSGAPYSGDNLATENTSNEVRIVELSGRRIKTVFDDKKTIKSDTDELTAVVNHINEVAAEHGIIKLAGPWLPELPERLSLEELNIDCGFNGETWKSGLPWLTVPIGMYDNPKLQQQGIQNINFATEGHYGIYGAPGTGKTTLLKTIVMSLGLFYSPRDVNIYILDCGGWGMSVFSKMPHVGGIALDSEEEKFFKFENLMNDEFEFRKKEFLKHSVNSLSAYREAVSDNIPAIVIAIDNIIPIFDLYPDLENFFVSLARDGATYGIYLVFTANSTSGVRYKVLQNIRGAVAFELTDKGDYATIVGRLDGALLPKITGRAFFKGNPPIEFQSALPAIGNTGQQMTLNLQKLTNDMNSVWSGVRPKPIPIMPDFVTYEILAENYNSRTFLPIGIYCNNIKPAYADLTEKYSLLISGPKNAGQINVLKALLKMVMNRFSDAKVFAFGNENVFSPQEKLSLYKCVDNNDETAVTDALSELVEMLNTRKKGQNQARSENPASFDEQKYISQFEMICIVIDDLKEFVDAVSNENKNTMERICRMAQNLGVIVLCAGAMGEIAKYNEVESLTRVIVGNQNGLAIESSAAQHTYFNNDLKYSEKEIEATDGIGLLFADGKCSRIKYIGLEGSV